MILVSIIYSYVFEEIKKSIQFEEKKWTKLDHRNKNLFIYFFIKHTNDDETKKRRGIFLFIYFYSFFQLITSVAYLTYFKIQVYYILYIFYYYIMQTPQFIYFFSLI